MLKKLEAGSPIGKVLIFIVLFTMIVLGVSFTVQLDKCLSSDDILLFTHEVIKTAPSPPQKKV